MTRAFGGCTDTNDKKTDFTTDLAPRNSVPANDLACTGCVSGCGR